MLRFMGSQRVGHDWASELSIMNIKPYEYCYVVNGDHIVNIIM